MTKLMTIPAILMLACAPLSANASTITCSDLDYGIDVFDELTITAGLDDLFGGEVDDDFDVAIDLADELADDLNDRQLRNSVDRMIGAYMFNDSEELVEALDRYHGRLKKIYRKHC